MSQLNEYRAYEKMLQESRRVTLSGLGLFGGGYFSLRKPGTGFFCFTFLSLLLGLILIQLPPMRGVFQFYSPEWLSNVEILRAAHFSGFDQSHHLFGQILMISLLCFLFVGLWWLSIVLPTHYTKPFFILARDKKKISLKARFFLPHEWHYLNGDYLRGDLTLLAMLALPLLSLDLLLFFYQAPQLSVEDIQYLELLFLTLGFFWLLSSLVILDLCYQILSRRPFLKRFLRPSGGVKLAYLAFLLALLYLLLFRGNHDLNGTLPFLKASGFSWCSHVLSETASFLNSFLGGSGDA